MTSRRGSGKSGKRRLSTEDEALWEIVSQAIEPLRRGKPRITKLDEITESPARELSPPIPRQHSRPPVEPETRKSSVLRVPMPEPPARPPRVPPLAEFDRRKAKKLAAGHEDIDARLDLHGMRQSEAHAALRAFLLSSFSAGRRNLLVITGKGGGAREDAESGGFMDTRERGVLKRNVPHWLAEPELRAIVVSYRAAAPHHGGNGALYIHLRSQRKAGHHRP